MQNGIFKLGVPEVVDSITTAIFVAVVVALGGVVQTPGFDLFAADWGSILHNVVNVGFIALIGQLANNFASDNSGKVFGVLG